MHVAHGDPFRDARHARPSSGSRTRTSLVRGAQGARPGLAGLESVVLVVLLPLIPPGVGILRRIRLRPRHVADTPQHVAVQVRTVTAVEGVVAAAGRRGAS